MHFIKHLINVVTHFLVTTNPKLKKAKTKRRTIYDRVKKEER